METGCRTFGRNPMFCGLFLTRFAQEMLQKQKNWYILKILWFQGEYIKSGRCSGYRFLSAGMFRLLCDWSVDFSCGRNDPKGKTRSEDKDIMWC